MYMSGKIWIHVNDQVVWKKCITATETCVICIHNIAKDYLTLSW